MFKLLSTTTVIPKTLFIADVKAEQHLGAVGIGGFGRVFRGEYKGQQVSLKTVERARHNNVCAITSFLYTTLIGLERIQF